jgi:hypothetical protein
MPRLGQVGLAQRAEKEQCWLNAATYYHQAEFARIFTAREGAEQHCQVGNSALAREEIVPWLSRFHPAMAPSQVEAAVA